MHLVNIHRLTFAIWICRFNDYGGGGYGGDRYGYGGGYGRDLGYRGRESQYFDDSYSGYARETFDDGYSHRNHPVAF